MKHLKTLIFIWWLFIWSIGTVHGQDTGSPLVDSLEVIATQNTERLTLLATVPPSELPRNPILDIEFSPMSDLVAVKSAQEFILWRVNDSQVQWRIPLAEGNAVAISPDGTSLAAAGNFGVYLWTDVQDSRAWQPLMWQENTSINLVRDIQFTGDGAEVVALISPSYGVYRWYATSGELLLENYEFATDENSMVTAAILSNDAQFGALYRRRPDPYIDFVETRNGTVLASVPVSSFSEPTDGSVFCELLTFTNNNQALFVNVSLPGAMGDSSLVVLSIEGSVIRKFDYDYEVFWAAGVFSPDGSLLILANAADQGLYFFDPTGTEQVAIVPSRDEGLRTLAISPDGKLLATGSGDGTVRLWGVPAGGE